MLDVIVEEAQPCPISYMLDVISAKWTVEILREVAINPVRTRAFLKAIPGLSMKSLLQRLQVLQAAGLILRTDFHEKPLRVEYSITKRGERIYKVMIELMDIAAETMAIQCKCPMDCSCVGEHHCPKRRVRLERNNNLLQEGS